MCLKGLSAIMVAIKKSNIYLQFLHYGTGLADSWRKSLLQFSTEAQDKAGDIKVREGFCGVLCLDFLCI